MNWINEAEAQAEEQAQFSEWRHDNLNELLVKYVSEHEDLRDKEKRFMEFERLSDMYNSTYETDEDFESYIEFKYNERR